LNIGGPRFSTIGSLFGAAGPHFRVTGP
jgi:hypothetical protein